LAQQLARRRPPQRVQIAVDQQAFQRTFQLLDVLGHGRLGHAQMLGGTAHAAALGHGDEDFEGAEKIAGPGRHTARLG